ncbi:hypothetical protein NBRC3280_2275 [Acetobacter pasteurianus NBRC 3280]|uniref:Uncharacterized protein n=1 Tax=Acetobacter pasteurianus NBRC 3278 TaxID=1226660 RepID=A0A401X6I5_ACEPA|nr:hypothetical protein [Acetobacter pasteurianus]GCD59759.1 hypothetical protein NBRC3277_2334 [Acetobacter pasteurianus NBRC 3277]GCD63269.1 hypothetical protein NBRC3278_2362 [Acetobacter pasteurianus NBRC 3278]GCD69640.1 hypothetical protein NBRC3280_2275 [Acetobacter pasteurianus NBRC 3280]
MNDEDFELEPLPKARSSSKSKKEEGLFLADHDAQNHKEHPNSVMIPFGRAFISWHSENGVAVLALIILIVLCLLSAFTEILATCTPNKAWADNFLKVIGQGIVATAGALVGAGGSIAVQKNTTRRNNRRL